MIRWTFYVEFDDRRRKRVLVKMIGKTLHSSKVCDYLYALWYNVSQGER